MKVAVVSTTAMRHVLTMTPFPPTPLNTQCETKASFVPAKKTHPFFSAFPLPTYLGMFVPSLS
jgi:hypothetical protein